MAGSNSVLVADTAQPGLVAPFYVVLEPDIPARREWIKVNTVTATAFENIDRGLEGSAGPPGVGVDHAVDSIVRAVFTKQLQDDLFHDIEANEANIANNVSGIAQNVIDISGNAGDIATIQTTYLPLTGGTLTGPLNMDGNTVNGLADPTGHTGAVPLKYLTDRFLPLSGGMLTGQLLATYGSESLPGLAFGGDPNTGFFQATNDTIGISTKGSVRLYVRSDGNFSGPGPYLTSPGMLIRPGHGDHASPTYTFNNDPNTGIYRYAPDAIGFASGGAHAGHITSSLIRFPQVYSNTSTGAVNMHIGSDGRLFRHTSSSRRYKKNIEDLDLTGRLRPRSFQYKDDYVTDDPKGEQTLFYFIAEEVYEEFGESAIEFNEDGEPEDVRVKAITAILAAKVNRLEELVGV